MKIKLKLNLNFSVPQCYQVQFNILIFNTFVITVSSKSNWKLKSTALLLWIWVLKVKYQNEIQDVNEDAKLKRKMKFYHG